MDNKLKFSKYLRGGEELLKVYQQHPACYVGSWTLGVLLTGLAFFGLWPLLILGTGGVVGFLALALGGAVVLGRAFRLWRGNVVLLTNERILDIDRSGFFSQTVSQVFYSDIQDISWSRRGLGAAIFRYGSVQLVCAGGSIRLVLAHLPSPATVSSDITAAKERPRTKASESTKAPPTTAQERERLVEQVYRQPERN
ncbi:MAG: PH domain-containing protein [Candidatus Kerfeldbacteria bacterium]|nr:PH domain-containing protein [Candidatus Kerfeldbacteria bacterium]